MPNAKRQVPRRPDDARFDPETLERRERRDPRLSRTGVRANAALEPDLSDAIRFVLERAGRDIATTIVRPPGAILGRAIEAVRFDAGLRWEPIVGITPFEAIHLDQRAVFVGTEDDGETWFASRVSSRSRWTVRVDGRRLCDAERTVYLREGSTIVLGGFVRLRVRLPDERES